MSKRKAIPRKKASKRSPSSADSKATSAATAKNTVAKARAMPAAKSTPVKVAPVAAAAPGAFDLKLVRDLARIANEYDLQEVSVSPDGGIRVSRASTAPTPVAQPLPFFPPAGTPTVSLVPAVAPTAVDDDAVVISSPFVGTFYRAPSPESDSFVEVGQMIRKGQVVCIVEAMKLMNEIEAESDGKLLEILVNNAEHVEYGQPLFRLAKS